ncbi:glutaredoxin family protein [Alkalihalobacterium alkalinitrilicum]|uniref:glutaredoxin family protein n=1 Tax=Alkalihalobacterium alkalinitrilicum TaxID=427920 RepID=UPI000994D4A1|nr:glutaredoxin family protein [Alkalihalobacterium alkalinitrilicum]
MDKLKVTFYTKENCSLCDNGLTVLKIIQEGVPFDIEMIDIYKDDELLEKYQVMIPVVSVDGEDIDYGILSEEKIRNRLLSVSKKN